MLRLAIIAATILPLALPAVALAKPKPIQFAHECGCICETPAGAMDTNVYRSKSPIDCQAYVGRTCNLDIGGQVRTGKLVHCTEYDPSGAAATLPSFTPADPAVTADPGQAPPPRIVPSELPQLQQLQ